MRTMTRNKAAEALGVTPQTISNYVKEGILGGFIGIKNTLYVNADDVDKYLKKYRFIAVKEEMIDRKIRELKDREKRDQRQTGRHKERTSWSEKLQNSKCHHTRKSAVPCSHDTAPVNS